MWDRDITSEYRSRSVQIAFIVGEWLMFATAVALIGWQTLAVIERVPPPPDGTLSVTALIVLSLAFAWNFRWLRGAPASIISVFLWIAASWFVILNEAFH